MAPKPRLEQAEFDEAVRTNLEDFGMEAEEAVKSAVEEFELQGYDLSAIVKSVDGSNTDSHPAAVAVADLESLRTSGAAAADPARLAAAAATLQSALRAGGDREAAQQAQVVANRAGAVPALLGCARDAFEAGADGSAYEAAVIACMRAVRALMATMDGRKAFREAGGCELAQALLRSAAGQAGGPLAAAVGALADSASCKEEENKCRFVALGFASDLLRLLESDTTSPAACAAAAGALRACTNADDENSTGSKCFAHARGLAKNDAAVAALLAALRRLGAGAPEAAAAVMAALKQIAANDDICRETMEAGGTDTLLGLLRGATAARVAAAGAAATRDADAPSARARDEGESNGDEESGKGNGNGKDAGAELARGAAGALRQLANSDAVKSQLAEAGALEEIVRGLRAFSSEATVQEELLGLLAALTLRMPAVASAAADAGAVEALIEVLEAQQTPVAAAATAAGKLQQRNGANGAVGGGYTLGGVARQACMAVRNMVVRNPELRPVFLDRGAEPLLRGAKARYGICGDVGSAALRDLGLDQYQ